ncbi:MAG: hypothetical protein NTZ74_12670 [Chloroflexi bacterium]|nr:hypothetical protein [Chloroflexota bacterium]
MSKKLQVKVNGNPYEVEIDDFSGNTVTVDVNGHTYAVEFEESGTPIVQTIAKPIQPAAVPAKASMAAVATAGPVASGDAITAPLPGVVMDISVKPGDKITVGQPVFALEAMKMKNIIRSTREGIVASVDATDGQRVAYGAVIIRFA